MFTIAFISLLSTTHTAPAKQTFTVQSLAQQTDERAGRDCSGGSTVKVYAHASDMGKVAK